MLGLVVLKGDRPPLTPAESRVLRAFCDQLALVLERDRLLRSATEAEVYRQTESVRRSLLAAVSHDLRSPLAAIKASVTDLLDEAPGTTAVDRREALEAIDAETDRLNALIANLLDMSRIQAGSLRARPQTVDLAETVAESVDRLRRQHEHIDVNVRIAPEAALVRADPVFLDRIMSNLLENAATAVDDEEHATIEVDVRRSNSLVAVRVIDHGPGVSPTAREQLFYPFYRMDDRNPRLGSGLGLAICKGFVTLLDGDIWIEDTPGGGATFSFSLPSADGGAELRKERDPRRRRRGPDPQGARTVRSWPADTRSRPRSDGEEALDARGELRARPGRPRPEHARHRRVRGLPAAPRRGGDVPSSCSRSARTRPTRSRRSTSARTTT